MSKRTVNDPSLHGWIDDNGKWVWGGTDGSAGAGMIVSETEPADPVTGMQWLNALTGEVFIYDEGKWLEMPGGKDGAAGKDGADAVWSEVTPDGDIYYDKGKVGIGTDSPNRTLTVNNNRSSTIAVQYNRDNSNGGDTANVIYQYAADGAGRLLYRVDNAGTENYIQSSQDFKLEAGAGGSLKFDTNGNNTRLTIDSTGDATFSGDVSVNNHNINGGFATFFRESASGQISLTKAGEFTVSAGATFSGNVVVGSTAGTFVRQQTAGKIDLTSALGPNSTGTVFEARANNGELTAEIRANGQFVSKGSPLTRTVDLIKTLSTLRKATMDETQDIRESLRSAIDEIVAGFEQQISTMEESE